MKNNYEVFIDRVRDCFSGAAGCFRVEMDCGERRPLDWLISQPVGSRYYWTDRDGQFEMAGIGECDVVEPDGPCSIQQTLRGIRMNISTSAENCRYYGGFRFHAGAKPNACWHDFKDYRFVLPLLELCRDGERCYWACNIRKDTNSDRVMDALLAAKSQESKPQQFSADFLQRIDLPDSAEWEELVRKALGAITSGQMQKVVLARQSTLRADSPVDPVALLRRLALRSANTYLFCFEPTGERAFLGASPERLYKRIGDKIYSEALAGTRPRGDCREADAQYEKELLQCDKEQREHQIVVSDIRAVLDEYCRDVVVADGPEVRKLTYCQHLHTAIRGVLVEGKSDTALLEALHPTPAVGGLPKEAAMRWIFDNEPFERGVYAGPVGWIGADDAEFCVGIRSGLIRRDTLTLYSGAGIVAGADARAEWRELDAKLANFLAVITKEG